MMDCLCRVLSFQSITAAHTFTTADGTTLRGAPSQGL